jgi:5'-3' exonuclease
LKKILDRDWFYEKYMIEPDQWSKVKSVAGCDTDNVAGVNGVGAITAIKYLKGQLTVKSKALAEIRANAVIIKRNAELVTLPMKGTKYMDLVEGEEFNSSLFVEVFQRYGFTSFLKEIDTWKRTLNMVK